ncbi:MAG: FAD-binding protein [Gammaproteobacteria bacterium]|nr:FAD-binding protein [Gammaproteobacteria bacterium]
MPENYSPNNVDQLLDLIKSGLANESRFSISGQDTKAGFGYNSNAGINIRMSSIKGILEYDPAELVMQARAGTPLSDIEEVLSEHEQHLAFEPPNLGLLYNDNSTSGTIGGAFMANLSGPRRFLAGAARDHILGVKALSGRGEVYKSGGNVIKNVTGYDLSKLLTGSWGTLSIVTELSFKVLPAPATSNSIAISGLDVDAAMDLISRVAQSQLQISGLAFIPASTLENIDCDEFSLEQRDLCLMRLEGSALSISERSKALVKLIAGSGNVTNFENEASMSLWQLIRNPHTLLSAGESRCVLKMSIAPANAKSIIRQLSSFDDCHWYVDAAGAWLWISLSETNAVNHIKTLRQSLSNGLGSAILYKAPSHIKQDVGIFSEMSSGLTSLTHRIKDSFDPNHILNPDRLYLQQ